MVYDSNIIDCVYIRTQALPSWISHSGSNRSIRNIHKSSDIPFAFRAHSWRNFSMILGTRLIRAYRHWYG